MKSASTLSRQFRKPNIIIITSHACAFAFYSYQDVSRFQILVSVVDLMDGLQPFSYIQCDVHSNERWQSRLESSQQTPLSLLHNNMHYIGLRENPAEQAQKAWMGAAKFVNHVPKRKKKESIEHIFKTDKFIIHSFCKYCLEYQLC